MASQTELSSGHSCPICMCQSTLSKNSPDQLSILKCGHLFCHSCISDWLKKSKECPNCKKVVIAGSGNGTEVIRLNIENFKNIGQFKLEENYDVNYYESSIKELGSEVRVLSLQIKNLKNRLSNIKEFNASSLESNRLKRNLNSNKKVEDSGDEKFTSKSYSLQLAVRLSTYSFVNKKYLIFHQIKSTDSGIAIHTPFIKIDQFPKFINLRLNLERREFLKFIEPEENSINPVVCIMSSLNKLFLVEKFDQVKHVEGLTEILKGYESITALSFKNFKIHLGTSIGRVLEFDIVKCCFKEPYTPYQPKEGPNFKISQIHETKFDSYYQLDSSNESKILASGSSFRKSFPAVNPRKLKLIFYKNYLIEIQIIEEINLSSNSIEETSQNLIKINVINMSPEISEANEFIKKLKFNNFKLNSDLFELTKNLKFLAKNNSIYKISNFEKEEDSTVLEKVFTLNEDQEFSSNSLENESDLIIQLDSQSDEEQSQDSQLKSSTATVARSFKKLKLVDQIELLELGEFSFKNKKNGSYFLTVF